MLATPHPLPNSPRKMAHVATVSINQTVGDWTGNQRRIETALDEAKNRGAKLIVFPEMCCPGYSLGDRLLMRGTLLRSWQMVEELKHKAEDCVVVVGLPVMHRDVIYNVAAVLSNGKIWGLVPKENLATGDVEYENRWYAGWPRERVQEYHTPFGEHIPMGGLLFWAKGLGRFAIEICEDGWKGIRPGSIYALAGAHIIANPSASWFSLGKHRIRRHMVEQISREDHCGYLYTSLMGCDATKLVFDGSSFIAMSGDIVLEGRRFVFDSDYEIIDSILDISWLERVRAEEGSWRQQSEQLLAGKYGVIPPEIVLDGYFPTATEVKTPSLYWRSNAPTTIDPSLQYLVDGGLIPRLQWQDIAHVELELGLSMALREYIKKCGVRMIALALSGGRDSTMCAVLVDRMLCYDNPHMNKEQRKQMMRSTLVTAYMGTENSGNHTRRAAKELAAELGALHYDGTIQQALDAQLQTFQQMTGIHMTWEEERFDIPLQNVQARLRGNLIWMVANVHNALLLTTSNKSEAAVGYATMDGDTSGGLAPIADVPKSLVIEWLDWANQFHAYKGIETVVSVPSTAELRPPSAAQTDEDDLMPFVILDQLMYNFVQLGQEPLEMFLALWPSVQELYENKPHAFVEHIALFIKKICFAQWKRERFAISFRVTSFDLDPKTGFRFPPVQAPFREEMQELRNYVTEQYPL